jgi:hypothetical protein
MAGLLQSKYVLLSFHHTCLLYIYYYVVYFIAASNKTLDLFSKTLPIQAICAVSPINPLSFLSMPFIRWHNI